MTATFRSVLAIAALMAGAQTLASNFWGPADFCVVPMTNGTLVVVPDLVTSELRFIKLAK